MLSCNKMQMTLVAVMSKVSSFIKCYKLTVSSEILQGLEHNAKFDNPYSPQCNIPTG